MCRFASLELPSFYWVGYGIVFCSFMFCSRVRCYSETVSVVNTFEPKWRNGSSLAEIKNFLTACFILYHAHCFRDMLSLSFISNKNTHLICTTKRLVELVEDTKNPHHLLIPLENKFPVGKFRSYASILCVNRDSGQWFENFKYWVGGERIIIGPTFKFLSSFEERALICDENITWFRMLNFRAWTWRALFSWDVKFIFYFKQKYTSYMYH